MPTPSCLELPAHANEKKALLKRLKQLSYREGDFLLASGQRSPFYLDARMTAMDAEGARLIGQLLWASVQPFQPDAVGGMAVGAVPLVSSVLAAAAAQGQPLQGFFMRKQAKEHGTARQFEGHLHPWMRVALLEDVVSTGGSTVAVIQQLRQAFPSVHIVGVFALVDRQLGGADSFAQHQVPFYSLYTLDAIQNA